MPKKIIFTPTACSLALRKLAVGAEPGPEKGHAEFISASLSGSPISESIYIKMLRDPETSSG
ncbi:hypothetical protein LCGC14_1471660 [marine sediment metagenome]|uniref:Uncharacterized protein n=1 Tax=marine sediment metagenome TaxID=412755 RepID=A0A0F9JCV4_9ZZZZ|nr:hypothetical protein [Candidatus Scalindua sediminis]HDY67956.1 hypothetical protein [Candidatus Scalindua sp.]